MPSRIGIPQCLDDRDRWKRGRRYSYIDRAYADAVVEAGGVPIYLPLQPDVAALIDSVDGLLLPGGDDFAPDSPYPEGVTFEVAPAEQLSFDRQLLKTATALKKPILGICYGMQLLALERGGTLHYHLPIDCPEADAHSLPEQGGEHEGRHGVRFEPGSRLATAFGRRHSRVNSLHHQGVADSGPSLVVTARAEDGLIEAVEDPLAGFCVGVQWHPEKLDGDDRRCIFQPFVDACGDT